jgi:hypothetical protein
LESGQGLVFEINFFRALQLQRFGYIIKKKRERQVNRMDSCDGHGRSSCTDHEMRKEQGQTEGQLLILSEAL